MLGGLNTAEARNPKSETNRKTSEATNRTIRLVTRLARQNRRRTFAMRFEFAVLVLVSDLAPTGVRTDVLRISDFTRPTNRDMARSRHNERTLMRVEGKDYRTVWMDGRDVKTINQPLLPGRFEIITLPDHRRTAEAIKTMIVRGAGAIGATAGYGMAQVFLETQTLPPTVRQDLIEQGYQTLRRTRPTAQDLFYALDRVRAAAQHKPDPAAATAAAVAEANALADENAQAGATIGQLGAPLIRDGATVLTHCNAGWLAFVDWGSALAPIYVAHRSGKKVSVLADETRPRCQGAQLTAWELFQEGVPVTVIADNAAGWLMRQGRIDLVITGADRIAANGDTANKIGTYEKALCAKANGVPFYIAAPTSTFDLACPNGGQIPIEERSPDEVLYTYGRDDAGKPCRVRVAPDGVSALNPAFDVTPAELIAGIITEKGILAPNRQAIAAALGK
jgi:S-methyl-5-thioribose-1-phosphate isomerase